MKKISITLFLLILFSSTIFAREEIRSYILMPRAAALGGAFVAFCDDENSLIFNPAGLTRVKQGKFVFLNPVVKLGEDYQKLMDMKDELDAAKNDQERAEVLRKFIPMNMPIEVNMYPHYVKENIGLIIFGKGVVRTEVLNPVTPRVEITGYYDVTSVVGYAKKINDKLSVGGSLKVINRNRVVDKIDETTGTCKNPPCDDVVVLYADDLSSPEGSEIEDKYIDYKKATGIGVDLGAIYYLRDDLTLGLAIYDVLDTTLDYGEGLKNKIPREVTIGCAYIPKVKEEWPVISHLKAKDIKIAFDISDVIGGGSLLKKMHIGTEANIFRKINYRMGLNSGYFTYGLGFRVGLFQIDTAYYQQERGRYVGQIPDKHYIISLTIRF